MNHKALLFGTLALSTICASPVIAEECIVGSVSGMTLNEEFGPGTDALTSCLTNTDDVKIVMQLNQACRDSYATHPVGKNGKPTGEMSQVVNNVASCNRPYALGNLGNMLDDLEITNGVENYDIKVVVHSGGGFLMLKGNKFEQDVVDLMEAGVEFYFCQNTVRSFMAKGILPAGDATANIIPGVQYVTAGVTAISDLQDQGYRYVQP